MTCVLPVPGRTPHELDARGQAGAQRVPLPVVQVGDAFLLAGPRDGHGVRVASCDSVDQVELGDGRQPFQQRHVKPAGVAIRNPQEQPAPGRVLGSTHAQHVAVMHCLDQLELMGVASLPGSQIRRLKLVALERLAARQRDREPSGPVLLVRDGRAAALRGVRRGTLLGGVLSGSGFLRRAEQTDDVDEFLQPARLRRLPWPLRLHHGFLLVEFASQVTLTPSIA
jgi:hypothetical protein